MFMLIATAAKAAGDAVVEHGKAKIAKGAAKSEARISNLMRKANNELAAAKGQYTRYQQARSNRAVAKAAESGRDALMTNYLRASADASLGAFDQRIQAAEEAGSLAAQVAASGMGGSTIDMMNATVALRQDRIAEAADRIGIQARSDVNAELKNFLPSMLMSLDETVYADDLNLAATQAEYTPKANYSAAASTALQGLANYYSTNQGVAPRQKSAGPSTRGGYRGAKGH